MAEDIYDVLIIGAGQAGVPLSHALAGAGKRVALVERQHLGGSCVNFGCTPTKAVIASAALAHRARRAVEFGLRIPTVDVDFAAVLDRAKSIVRDFRGGIEKGLRSTENPKLLHGHARLEGRIADGFRVNIADQAVTAKQVVLDTGTRSLIPPIDGLSSVDYIHAGNWLDHSALPEYLLIIGGGYVGLEMAQFYRRMGSHVTVLQRAGQVMPREDAEVASELQKLLEAEAIEFHLNSQVVAVRRDEEGLSVMAEESGCRTEISCSHLFVAVGRVPNTNDLGLETVGVRTSERGIVEIDERLRTSVPGIWVAGDIRGNGMFTHTAWDDYRILFSQIVGDGSDTTDRVMVYAIFTDPQLGRAGMTETEARATGKPVKIGLYEMKHNGRAIETGDTQGFIKVVIDANTDSILGAAVLAAEGAELVHMYAEVMNADAPYTVIRDAIHIHPTLAEAVQSAVSSLEAR